jgi:hypothetical protein
MREPRFDLMDVVVVMDTGVPHRKGVVGARGVVTQRRRYPDGQHRYIVAASDNDDANGIWDEADLAPTAEKRTLDLFASHGRYQMRDVVIIEPADEEDAALTGARGVIDGWTDVSEGDFAYLVFVEGRGEQTVWLLTEAELTPIGERLPPPQPGRPATSTRVSEAGGVLGQVDYIILDAVSDYL